MPLKIALISLYVIENNGVRMLAAMLRQAGFTVHEIYFKDYRHHRFDPPTELEIQRLTGLLRDLDVGLVGFSVRAGAYLTLAKMLTERVRQAVDAPIIWGGPHVSFAPDDCIGSVDYISVGESEDAMVDLARALESGEPTDNIANIWTHRDGEIIRNDVRPLEQNLDRYPFRDYHSHEFKFWIDGKRLRRGDPMINETIYLTLSTRGCLFNCSFCDVNVLKKLYRGKGQFFRVRSVGNIIEELRYARKHFKHLARVRVDDELFPVDKTWIREFAAAYKAEFDWPFEILSDPRVINDEDIALLADAGLTHVLLGIQGAQDLNRDLYGRPCTDDKVIEVSKILQRHKVRGGFQIILDNPVVSENDRRALLELLLALARPFDLYTFSLSYWPGADLTDRFLEEGVIGEDDVEGKSDKVLRQFRVDSSFPRPPEDRLWIALYHLTSKSVVPRGLIRRMSQSAWLMKNPWPAEWLSNLINFGKLGWLAFKMLIHGELSWNMVKRWLNFSSPASI